MSLTTPHQPQSFADLTEVQAVHSSEEPVPLYTQEFADDPQRFYAWMREKYGPLVPVELAPGILATLVIGYHTAVVINNDPDRFPADPRAWQKNVPPECPVKPMLEHRDNALRSAGQEHARYRKASVDSLDAIYLDNLHTEIEHIAIPLINSFCRDGNADLISQYALPVTFAYLNQMVGCPADIGQDVATGMAMMFEGSDAATGSALFASALARLVDLKHEQPGVDVTTRLVNHPAELNGQELVQQLVTIYGAGIEPLTNLIANTLLLMLTDDRFQGHAALTTHDALNELLFNDPPLANFLVTYPRQPTLVDGVWLPANQPVVTSLAACNNDPAIAGEFNGNNSHIGWGTGPHTCPAQVVARTVAQHAIDQLFDALPEIRLARRAEELVWRPGPFHRSLAGLPVVFPPSQLLFSPTPQG